MMTEKKDKNISVTLVTPQDSKDNEITISFGIIFAYLKRFFILWLILAIIVGLISVGVGILLQKSVYVGNATALISLNYDGADQGLDPNGNKLDITKIKSPSVITDALKSLDIKSGNIDSVRQSIDIQGVVPKEAMDKISLYYKSFTDGSQGLQAAQSLLDSSYNSTEYIISFNYFKAGFTFEQGKEILNAVLNSYRDYFFESYNFNNSLGNSITVLDYKDYDYAEAANIFSSNLDSITDYLNNIKSIDSDLKFRSSSTGYSFDDLISTCNTLKQIDLDRLTSYITINNVTSNDIDSMVSYYEYMVEDLERKEDIDKSKIASIDDSIRNYEKDPLILVVGDSNSSEDETTEENTDENDEKKDKLQQMNKAYDDLVQQRLDTQKQLSEYEKSVKYFNQVINSFKKAKKVNKKDIEVVKGYLEDLDSKMDDLISNVNKTSDEYYSKVAFSDSFKILVPASGTEAKLVSGSVVKPIIIAEAAMFLIYVAAAFIRGIIMSNKKSKVSKETEENTSTE